MGSNRVQAFMNTHVRPAVPIYKKQDEEGPRWKVIPILEDLKKKAIGLKASGTCSCRCSSHEDDEFRGAGLSNLEYEARLALRRWVASPGRRKLQLLRTRYRQHGSVHALCFQGAEAQMAAPADGRRNPLRLPDDGTGRGVFTTNIETRIEKDGDHYVINGRKWSFGVGDPRCKVAILMGKTLDPKAARHQAAVANPDPARCPRHQGGKDAAGVRLSTTCRTAMRRCCWRTSAFPRKISCSARAGASRSRRPAVRPAIDHCMRTIGKAEEALEKMVNAALAHRVFGKTSSSIRSGNSASPKPAPISR